ncbi:unnamed protein product [Larinioides sclopetarius]|uniref:Acyltransferase 3 domain-containing protein n=1 Tax=Larinioides sclopetarius TaxID=280406 RepID=A0AAV2A1F1_9ARAC
MAIFLFEKIYKCMEWCWYLAADMQFYIISPIFLISLIRNPKFGYILTGACIAASCLANFIITKQYNLVDGFSRMEYHFTDLNQFFDQYWTYFDLVYIKPYTRISSYLIAILLAHYLYKNKLKIKCSQGVLLFGWISTDILWLTAYFALFKREESITENAVYNGLKHLFYSIGLSWIIFTCLTEQGGLINKCLSLKVFSPLAKLSYCAYLIHPLVLMRYYQTAEYLEDLSASSVLVLTAYVYFWTYVFSFMACLLFEFPFLNLLDLISTKKTDKTRI